MPTFELIEETPVEQAQAVEPTVQMQAVRPRPPKADTEPTFELVEETTAPPKSSGGLMNVLEQIPGGATAALVEVGETLKSVGDYIREQVPAIKEVDPGDQFSVPIPQFEEPQSAAAGLVKGASQFLTAFLPFSKLAKGIGITGAFAKGMTAGALADLTAFDPDDPKLSDMINELAPALKNPLTEYLASDPTDTDAEKRFKRALEGAGLGVITEGIFRAGKAILTAKKAKALRLAEQATPEPETVIQRPQAQGIPENQVATRTAGRTEAVIQSEIDAMEDAIEQAGGDITKLYNPNNAMEAKVLGKPGSGYSPMPQRLADLFDEREAIYSVQKSEFIAKVMNDTGLTKQEASRGLRALGLENDQFTAIFQKRLDRLGSDAVENLSDIYNSFASQKYPDVGDALVDFKIRGAADQPRLVAKFGDGRRPDPELLKKTEALYNAVAQNIGQEPISFFKHGVGDGKATPSVFRLDQPSLVGEDLNLNVAKESTKPNPPAPRLSTEITGDPEILPKYAGSINLERLQTDDGVKRAIIEASEEIPKRAPITADESVELASSLGYTLDDAEKLATATQAQRHGALAARNVLATAAEAYEAARATFVQSQSPADFARLKSAETAFLRSFNASQKIASEMGFGLQSFRQMGKADLRTLTEKQINKLMAQLLAKGPISDEITRRLAALDKTNPQEIHAFLEYMSTKTATVPEKAFEAFLSSILSGPQTHAANILGNFANVAIRPMERVAYAGADIFLSPIKPRDRFFGEAAVDVMGMVGAFDDAVRAFSRTMKTGMVSFGTKFEIAEAGSKLGGTTGHIIRTPLRLLSAADEFFKILARQGDLNAQAYRLGVKQGLKSGALLDFTTDLARNPTEEMLKAAQLEATYRTFQKELGPSGQTISMATRSIPGVKYLAPFVKTPINIAKYGLERTPLKAFDLIRMAAKGQLSKNGELSEEVGKLAIGLGLQAWVATQVIAGNLTGSGPGNPADRSALRQTGWQPQSIRLFGEYYSYARLEPFATAIGIMADATELVQAGLEVGAISELDRDELINGLMAIAVQNVSDKTFLQGLTDTSNVLSDPSRYFSRWSQQRVRAVIPNVIGQAARAQDPLVRRTNSMLDAIRGQLPKIGDFEGRQGLFPVRDYFGEPIEQQGNFWYRYLVPIRKSTIESTQAEEKIAEVGARVLPLERDILVNNTRVELTPEEYDRYQILAGKWAKIKVEAVAGSLGRLTQEQQKDLIQDAFRSGRKVGRDMMKMELMKTHPQLKRVQ